MNDLMNDRIFVTLALSVGTITTCVVTNAISNHAKKKHKENAENKNTDQQNQTQQATAQDQQPIPGSVAGNTQAQQQATIVDGDGNQHILKRPFTIINEQTPVNPVMV